ncbi:hypothetical protein MKZ38_003766 [Zalerion maritima]|uniref:2EXR domain-containing protein n=1 Tax=Zalerion maritima TaxID=339359 RepID=A0AAD5WS56_9PEZI|nr:hypothetical protein MKZ38_003766 [Zalerion maritima]
MAHSLDDSFLSLLGPSPPTRSRNNLRRVESGTSFTLCTTILDDKENISFTSPSPPQRPSLARPSWPTPPSSSLQEFHLFPSLPTELRLKVWKHAIFPRIIIAAVVPCKQHRTNTSEGADSEGIRFEMGESFEDVVQARYDGKWEEPPRRGTQRLVPPILQVNRESRMVGLENYGMGFSWKPPPSLGTRDFVEGLSLGGGNLHHDQGHVLGSGRDENHSFSPLPSHGVADGAQDTSPSQQLLNARLSRSSQPSPSPCSSSQPIGELPGPQIPSHVLRMIRTLPLTPSEQQKLRPPRLFFSPDHDTLLLAGDLEPWDSETGLSHPAAYFFLKHEASRVKHLALLMKSLRIDHLEAEDVATVLFHVVDRFTGLEGNRLEVWVEEGDEEIFGLDGGHAGRAGERVRGRFEERSMSGTGKLERSSAENDGLVANYGGGNNVISKIWKACMGTHARSSVAGQLRDSLRIEMVAADERF